MARVASDDLGHIRRTARELFVIAIGRDHNETRQKGNLTMLSLQ